MTESIRVAAARRARLLESCPRGVVVVRGAGPDGLNPNFFYLTGLTEPSAVLVLSAWLTDLYGTAAVALISATSSLADFHASASPIAAHRVGAIGDVLQL